MANVSIPNLPAAVALSGEELLEGVQAGVSVRVTTRQIADMSTSSAEAAAISAAAAAVAAGDAAQSAADALVSEMAAALSADSAAASEVASAANAAAAAGAASASVRNAAGVVNLKGMQGLAIDGLLNSCAVIDFVTSGNNYSDTIASKVTFSRSSEVQVFNDLKVFNTVASGSIALQAFSPEAARYVGYQIQPARTRLNRYCFGNNWAAAGFTVTTGQTAVFNGANATSAVKYVCTTANDQKMIRIISGTIVTYESGKYYTQQYYFKPTNIGVYGRFLFQMPSTRFGITRVKVDLNSMTFLFSDATVLRKSISYVGLGYYKLEMMALATSTGTGEYGRMSVADPAAASNSVTDTFAGDGVNGFTLSYYGIEEGRYATTPISASNGTAGTARNADSMTLTCSVLPSFVNGFTATVDLTNCPDTGAGNHVVFQIDDGTASNSIRLESGAADSLGLQVTAVLGGVTTSDATQSYVLSASNINRFFLVYDPIIGIDLYDETNTVLAHINASACPAPSVFNTGTIYFGCDRSASNFWAYPMNMFRIFPAPLSDSEREYLLPFGYLPTNTPPEAPYELPQGLSNVVMHADFRANRYYPEGLAAYFASDTCNGRTTSAYAYSPQTNRAYKSLAGTISRTEMGLEICSNTITNRIKSGRNFADANNWLTSNMTVGLAENMTGDVTYCLLTSTAPAATIEQTVSGFLASDILTFNLQAVTLTGTVEMSIDQITWIDITDQLSTTRYVQFNTPEKSTAPATAKATLRFGSSGTSILSDFAAVTNANNVAPLVESLTNATGSRNGDFVRIPLSMIGFTDFANCTVIVNAIPMTNSGGTFWTVSPDGDFNNRVIANYLGDNGASSVQTPTSCSGNGTTVTIGFAGPQTYTVGKQINVYGIEPAGYNGQWTVTASTSTSVSYACTETGVASFPSGCRVGYNKWRQAGLTTGEGTGATEQGTDPAFPNVVRQGMSNRFVAVMNRTGAPAGQFSTLTANRVYVSLNGSKPVESSAITTWYVTDPDYMYVGVQTAGGGGAYIIIQDITVIDYPYELYEMSSPAPTPAYYFGSFYDTTTQTNAGATVANAMTCNTTVMANGVRVDSGKFYVQYAGKYNIQFSAQFDKTDAGDDDVEVWLSVNGSNVSNSSSIVTLHSNNGRNVAAWNWFQEFAANDYFQIFWNSADVDLRILARTTASTPSRPAIPSVIVTVNNIG